MQLVEKELQFRSVRRHLGQHRLRRPRRAFEVDVLACNDAEQNAFFYIVMADNVLIHFRPYLGQTCQNIHKRVPLIVVQRLIVLRRWKQPAEFGNRSTPYGGKAKAIL